MLAPSTQNAGTGERRPFRIEGWRVDPACGYITRDGKDIHLEPRVMDVLIYLVERAGKVVSREDLQASVWAGRVVSYDALTGAMQKLRKALGDDPRHPRIIETLSKKGYRLIATVASADEVARDNSSAAAAVPGDRGHAAMARGAALVLVALALIAVVVFFVLRSWRPAEELPNNAAATVSIAVLPFDNLGGLPEQEYFADGMTDDLITELAKDPGLLVIARDSAFLYKGQSRDVRRVAENLNVRYILSGSVRRVGDRLRLNVQLTDTATDSHLWAEHYDGRLSNVFALQDEIVGRIVSALASRIGPGAQVSRKRQKTVSPKAYDYFLLGRNSFFRYASKDENLKARELYAKAIELDPGFATAYAMLAWTYAFEAMNGWSASREESLTAAYRYATRALELDKGLPVAYFVTGLVHREKGEYRQALEEAEKAIALDPNYANAHVLLATLLYYTGQPRAGLEKIKKAMQLNPHHPYNYPFHLGQAYFILGQYQEAIDAFMKGLASNPSSERLRVWLAASYARAGREDDARWEAEQVLAQNPGFSLDRIKQAFPFKDPADLERFLGALRIAGFGR